MCLISPSVQHYAYQQGSQPLWIAPLLAWCWRYVLMKKGDDEEGEHLHSWLPEESITAAYYYIKQLGAPQPPDYGRCFPHDDTVRWWLLTPAGSEYVACLQWCHCTNPSGQLSWNVLQWIKSWEDRGGKFQCWGRDCGESFDNDNKKSKIDGVPCQTNEVSWRCEVKEAVMIVLLITMHQVTLRNNEKCEQGHT